MATVQRPLKKIQSNQTEADSAIPSESSISAHFTTFRARWLGGTYLILALHAHLERLRMQGEAIYGMPVVSKATILETLKEALATTPSMPLSDLRVRITISRELLEVTTLPVEKLAPAIVPIHLIACTMVRSAPILKTDPAHTSIESTAIAEANGCAEAILCFEDGTVSETGWGNLLWIEDQGKALHLSAAPSLPGITQELIVEIYRDLYPHGVVVKDLFTVETIAKRAQSALVTSSVRGPSMVQAIGKHQFTLGGEGARVASEIIERFRSKEFWIERGDSILA